MSICSVIVSRIGSRIVCRGYHDYSIIIVCLTVRVEYFLKTNNRDILSRRLSLNYLFG